MHTLISKWFFDLVASLAFRVTVQKYGRYKLKGIKMLEPVKPKVF